MLDGSASFDPDDGLAMYSWKQIGGPPVTLSDPGAIRPAFTAPEVGVDGESLTFQLTRHGSRGTARQGCLYRQRDVGEPSAQGRRGTGYGGSAGRCGGVGWLTILRRRWECRFVPLVAVGRATSESLRPDCRSNELHGAFIQR